jgi:predicted PurR-regulated permease PerM
VKESASLLKKTWGENVIGQAGMGIAFGLIFMGVILCCIAVIGLAIASGSVALVVVAAIVAIQQIEGDLLYPNVVGRMIRLHPVAILLVLTAGTVVAGILGALLSIPVAAAAWTAYRYTRERLDEEEIVDLGTESR